MSAKKFRYPAVFYFAIGARRFSRIEKLQVFFVRNYAGYVYVSIEMNIFFYMTGAQKEIVIRKMNIAMVSVFFFFIFECVLKYQLTKFNYCRTVRMLLYLAKLKIISAVTQFAFTKISR